MSIEEKTEKLLRVERNRKEINDFLSFDLPIDIIYYNIRRLSKSNERLLNEIKEHYIN